jgi:FkbM family methyltransferase
VLTIYRIHGLELELDDAMLPDIVRRALSRGWYERDEVEILRAALRPGDRVVELGAGLGVTSMVAAGTLGAEAVSSFEANPALLPVIRANAARNGFDLAVQNRVLLPSAAVVGRPMVTLDVGGAFWASSVVAKDTALRPVEVETGALEAELARHRASVLVMDIEGLEVEVLELADLSALRALVFEIHYDRAGRERTDAAVIGLLDRGFRLDFQRSSRGVLLAERQHP